MTFGDCDLSSWLEFKQIDRDCEQRLSNNVEILVAQTSVIMKLSILALLMTSAAAFAPSSVEVRYTVPQHGDACHIVWFELSFMGFSSSIFCFQRSATALNSMDRRSAFSAVTGAAAVVAAAPQLAFADGAVSAATVQKARAVYGSRIYDLKSAVDSGNFDAVAGEKNAFILFNSGAYPTAKSKAEKKAAIEGTNAIFAAVKSGDKAALKSAYSSYIAANGITPLPTVDNSTGQGYSSDYDYRRLSSAGAIYVR